MLGVKLVEHRTAIKKFLSNSVSISR